MSDQITNALAELEALLVGVIPECLSTLNHRQWTEEEQERFYELVDLVPEDRYTPRLAAYLVQEAADLFDQESRRWDDLQMCSESFLSALRTLERVNNGNWQVS